MQASDTWIVFQQGGSTYFLCSLPVLHMKVFSVDPMKHMVTEMAQESILSYI